MKPTGNLRTLLGADATRALAKVWTDEILPAAAEIERGYPFEDGAADADLTKLTAFLNPSDGRLSKFYQERLAQYFEEAGGQLKVRETSDVQFSDEFVAYLNNAFRLRTALFGTSATPKFEYEFSLQPVPDAIVEVTGWNELAQGLRGSDAFADLVHGIDSNLSEPLDESVSGLLHFVPGALLEFIAFGTYSEFHQLDRMVEAGRHAARALLEATGGDLRPPAVPEDAAVPAQT